MAITARIRWEGGSVACDGGEWRAESGDDAKAAYVLGLVRNEEALRLHSYGPAQGRLDALAARAVAEAIGGEAEVVPSDDPPGTVY